MFYSNPDTVSQQKLSLNEAHSKKQNNIRINSQEKLNNYDPQANSLKNKQQYLELSSQNQADNEYVLDFKIKEEMKKYQNNKNSLQSQELQNKNKIKLQVWQQLFGQDIDIPQDKEQKIQNDPLPITEINKSYEQNTGQKFINQYINNFVAANNSNSSQFNQKLSAVQQSAELDNNISIRKQQLNSQYEYQAQLQMTGASKLQENQNRIQKNQNIINDIQERIQEHRIPEGFQSQLLDLPLNILKNINGSEYSDKNSFDWEQSNIQEFKTSSFGKSQLNNELQIEEDITIDESENNLSQYHQSNQSRSTAQQKNNPYQMVGVNNIINGSKKQEYTENHLEKSVKDEDYEYIQYLANQIQLKNSNETQEIMLHTNKTQKSQIVYPIQSSVKPQKQPEEDYEYLQYIANQQLPQNQQLPNNCHESTGQQLAHLNTSESFILKKNQSVELKTQNSNHQDNKYRSEIINQFKKTQQVPQDNESHQKNNNLNFLNAAQDNQPQQTFLNSAQLSYSKVQDLPFLNSNYYQQSKGLDIQSQQDSQKKSYAKVLEQPSRQDFIITNSQLQYNPFQQSKSIINQQQQDFSNPYSQSYSKVSNKTSKLDQEQDNTIKQELMENYYQQSQPRFQDSYSKQDFSQSKSNNSQTRSHHQQQESINSHSQYSYSRVEENISKQDFINASNNQLKAQSIKISSIQDKPSNQEYKNTGSNDSQQKNSKSQKDSNNISNTSQQSYQDMKHQLYHNHSQNSSLDQAAESGRFKYTSQDENNSILMNDQQFDDQLPHSLMHKNLNTSKQDFQKTSKFDPIILGNTRSIDFKIPYKEIGNFDDDYDDEDDMNDRSQEVIELMEYSQKSVKLQLIQEVEESYNHSELQMKRNEKPHQQEELKKKNVNYDIGMEVNSKYEVLKRKKIEEIERSKLERLRRRQDESQNEIEIITPKIIERSPNVRERSPLMPSAQQRSKKNKEDEGEYRSIDRSLPKNPQQKQKAVNIFKDDSMQAIPNRPPSRGSRQGINIKEINKDDSFILEQQKPTRQTPKNLSANKYNPKPDNLKPKKTNKPILKMAIQNLCLAGEPNKREREYVLSQIDMSESEHFIILLKGAFGRMDFRALYGVSQDSQPNLIFQLHKSPTTLDAQDVGQFFKYDSGSKEFKIIQGIKSFSYCIDAVKLRK